MRLALVLFLAAAGTASAQNQPTQWLRVAVMDLSTQTTVTVAFPPPSESARGLTEMLPSVLIRTNGFIVLERAAIQQIEQEQTIGQTKTTKETGAQQGAMLGAQVPILGDITGFTFNKSSLGGSVTNIIKGLSVAAEKVSADATMTTPLGQASRQALQEAVVGLLMGMPKMRPGLELEVYEAGEALVDPATGQSLGQRRLAQRPDATIAG